MPQGSKREGGVRERPRCQSQIRRGVTYIAANNRQKKRKKRSTLLAKGISEFIKTGEKIRIENTVLLWGSTVFLLYLFGGRSLSCLRPSRWSFPTRFPELDPIRLTLICCCESNPNSSSFDWNFAPPMKTVMEIWEQGRIHEYYI